MTTETTTTERNWAPIIQAELKSAGFTITGMPEHLNAEQTEALLTSLRAQALANKAHQ